MKFNLNLINDYHYYLVLTDFNNKKKDFSVSFCPILYSKFIVKNKWRIYPVTKVKSSGVAIPMKLEFKKTRFLFP